MSWPRDAFVSAVWSSSLKPNQRLVALAYADHAGDQEHSWVTYPRLQERTGLSRDAIARAIKALQALGWLVMKEAARQQRSPRYWLRVPDQQSASQTAGRAQGSVSRTADDPSPLSPGPMNGSSSPSPDTSSPSPDTSSPGDGPDFSSHSSNDLSLEAREDADVPRPPTHPLDTVPAEHRTAVIELVARLGRDVTEVDAADCAAWVAAKRKPDNLAGYLSRFTAEDVRTRAEQHRHGTGARPEPEPDPRKCDHGVINGQQVLGRGANASRRCDRCEHLNPADNLPTREAS